MPDTHSGPTVSRSRSPKRTLGVFVAASIAASLAMAPSASAHNINVPVALGKAQAYAKRVVADPTTPYIRWYATIRNCVAAFPGHNHYARCRVSYDTPQSLPTDRYACSEVVEVFHRPGGDTQFEQYRYYMQHAANQYPCSRIRLRGGLVP